VNGFQQLCTNRMANAKILRDAIKAMVGEGAVSEGLFFPQAHGLFLHSPQDRQQKGL